MSRQIGPSLPPDWLLTGNQSNSESKSWNQKSDKKGGVMIGPALPRELLENEDKSPSKRGEISNRDVIGPALPPGFRLRTFSDSDSQDSSGSSSSNQNSDNKDSCYIGPALPPGFVIGKESEKDVLTKSKAVIGPALPPDLVETRPVGPALPPDYVPPLTGPALPPVFYRSDSDDDDDNNDDVIGPKPSEICGAKPSVSDEFERRVLKMKEKLEGGTRSEEKPKRESWMTELPSTDLCAQLGLGARQFRTKNAPMITEADREAWTKVEGEGDLASSTKNLKRHADKDEIFPEEIIKERKIAKEVKKYNESARSESLMEMHSKKLKKEEKRKNDEKPERMPFDRERDLNTRQFDDAQRNAILKKAAKLDSRFSHGGKHYL